MTIQFSDLSDMLGAARSRDGVAALLSALSRKESAAHRSDAMGLRLHNDGGITVSQFKKLRAPLAEKVVEVSDNVDLLRHVHARDKRQGVRRALGTNPNLPDDVGSQIGEDPDDLAFHLALSPVHSGSMDELLEFAYLRPMDVLRIVRQASDGQLQEWLEDSAGMRALQLCKCGIPEPTWDDMLRLLKFTPDSDLGEVVVEVVSHAPVRIDWSESVWLPLVKRMEGHRVPRTQLSPSNAGPAPVSWLRMVLANTDNVGLRGLALSLVEPAALNEPEFDDLPLGELLTLRQFHYAVGTGFGVPLDTVRRIVAAGAAIPAARLTNGSDPMTLARNLDQDTVEDLAILSLQGTSNRSSHDYRILYVMRRFASSGAAELAFLVATGFVRPASADFLERLKAVIDPSRVNLSQLRELAPTADAAWRRLDPKVCEALFSGVEIRHFYGYGCTAIDASTIRKLLVCEFERRVPDAGIDGWNTLLTIMEDWDGPLSELIETVQATV